MMGRVNAFPTVCDSIVGRRDPVLYERMKAFFETGKAIALVGVSHCRGIRAFLERDGYHLRSAAIG